MKRSVLTTVLITVLAVAALGAMAFGVYQIGFQAGLVDSGADVVVNRVHDGLRGVGWGGWGGWGFGFFGLIFRILFFVLVFGLIARLVFGPRRWGWGPGPHWGGYQGPNHPMEERLTEWHDKAHRGPEQTDPGPAQRE